MVGDSSRAFKWIVALGLTLVACTLAIWVSWLLGQSAVSSAPATCLSRNCFCEADSLAFPRQLANSFSSLGFVLLGLWGAIAVRKPDQDSPERKLWPWFTSIMVFIGASSFYYHASLSFFGQFLDIFSMFLLGTLLIVGGFYRSGRLSGRIAIVVFVLASVVLGIAEYFFPDFRRVIFAIVIVAGIVIELSPGITGISLRSRKGTLIMAAVALLVVAFVIWTADLTGWLCDPNSIFQGHAIWHLLTAVAAFLVLFHYRNSSHNLRSNPKEVN
ncbi:MAG: ceramidase domain-containing protein [Microbacteriaceae bacterium]|nr:ceramidase domain-containing protein [Microbacteriaceae bacterium]